jgi:hypothetical protein
MRPLVDRVLPLRALPLCLAALAAVSSPAAAQKGRKSPAAGRWRQIGVTASGNPVFVDPKSVSRANGIVTATLRTQFVEPVQTPQGAWTSARTVAMFDCARQTVAVKENTYFIDEKKNIVAQHKVVGIPGYGPVLKGALPEVGMQYLCAAGGAK